MKKFLVAFFSITMVLSFSAAVFAANPVKLSPAKITKQIILAEDEPAPEPVPAPEPE